MKHGQALFWKTASYIILAWKYKPFSGFSWGIEETNIKH